MGWIPRNRRPHAVAYLWPLLYGAIVHGLVWMLRLGAFNQEMLRSGAEQLGMAGAPALSVFLIGLATAGTFSLVIYFLPGSLC